MHACGRAIAIKIMTMMLGALGAEAIIISSIPQQPPLVCEDLYQNPSFLLYGGDLAVRYYTTYAQTYCHQLYEVVCWKNQTDTWARPGYPPYLMQSPSGLFVGAGISFDVYKTDTGSNSTYYRWPYDTGRTNLFVDRSSLASNGGLVITSYFEGIIMGEASFLIDQYKLVLQYPWFSVMNASGADCSKTTFLVHKKDVIATPAPLHMETTGTPAIVHTTPAAVNTPAMMNSADPTTTNDQKNTANNAVVLPAILGALFAVAVVAAVLYLYFSQQLGLSQQRQHYDDTSVIDEEEDES